MKMETIVFIDYCGSCDREGKAIGHSPKVLNEYADLLKDSFRLEAILPLCVHEAVKTEIFAGIMDLPYQITEEGERGLLKRVLDKYKMFRNIDLANRYCDNRICWYYRTDFFLFLYYFFHRKPKDKKMICLLYQQKFAEGLLGEFLNFIFQKGLSKFDAVIYTQKNMTIPHSKKFYMPDYYYDEKYEKYKKIPKENKVVCLGTMNPYKELEKLIDVFNENGVKLEIAGKFLDKQRYLDLQRRAKENILIENVVLSEDDYYRKLASAKYSILPYDMKLYEGRTSGVLLETVFVGTMPIAPKRLLEENQVSGIGYESLNDIAKICFEQGTDDFAVTSFDILDKEELKKEIYKFIYDEMRLIEE